MFMKRCLVTTLAAALFVLPVGATDSPAGPPAGPAPSTEASDAPTAAPATIPVPAEGIAGESLTAEGVQTPPAMPPADCCPQPCIIYRCHGPKLCCGDCRPGVETVLRVKDPCTCCEVEVKVCVPACCTGEPTICAGVGFLCRDIVTYEWCCGYKVRVAFKHCGDVLVSTWGR
jgi:hypothetical protein